MKLPVEKNQTYTMSITDIGTNGEGIGRIDGYTVFVEGALPVLAHWQVWSSCSSAI